MNYEDLTWLEYSSMIFTNYGSLVWSIPSPATEEVPIIERSATLLGLGLGI